MKKALFFFSYSRKCRSRNLCLSLCLLGVVAAQLVLSWNQSFVDNEVEAPLDHWKGTIKKAFVYCPKIKENQSISFDGKIPIFMLSARPRAQVELVYQSWNGFDLSIINTADFSRNYQNLRCKNSSFESRLFAVYQFAIRQILGRIEEKEFSHVILIEDDVELLDKTSFLLELNWAVNENLDYYSFYNSNPGCVYSHGMLAQVASREFLSKLLHVETRIFCRLPIDLYISMLGPWFETQRNIVKHIGTRFHVDKNNNTSAQEFENKSNS